MGESQMPDKMKLVRDAGESIRSDLAKVIEHRFEQVVDDEGLEEIRTLLKKLAHNYLSQIIPDVEVRILSQSSEKGLKLQLMVTGVLTISVEADESTP